jgi:hypothetical protein
MNKFESIFSISKPFTAPVRTKLSVVCTFQEPRGLYVYMHSVLAVAMIYYEMLTVYRSSMDDVSCE